MKHSDRVVLFIGAGASVPLGFPGTAAILPAILSGLRPGLRDRQKPEWRRAAEQRDPHFAANLRQFFAQVLPGIDRQPTGAGCSIVDVLSTLDQLVLDQRSPSPNFREDKLREARRSLALAMNGVLQGRRKPSLRRDLVAWLLGGPSSRKVSVISTNYDVAYELPLYKALAARKRPPAAWVDMGTSFRDQGSAPHHRPPEATLAFFKLHGSLNWLRCEVCGQLYVNTRQRIASLEFWRQLRPYNMCVCRGWLRSVLVTPSLVRNVREPHLLSIWNAALEDLRAASEWIFVGYSLPQEDIAIRTLLLRAFHARRPAPLRVRVALRDEAAQRERAISAPVGVQKPQPAGKECPVHARARYQVFFPADVYNDDTDYFPGGTEEIVAALTSEISRTMKPRTVS